MRPHPRIRKTVKWGGAAVTFLLLVAWIGSEFRLVELYQPRCRWYVILLKGALSFEFYVSTHPDATERWCSWQVPRLHVIEQSGRGAWWWSSSLRDEFRIVYVPLWMPVGACVIGAFPAWLLDARAKRRLRKGLCPRCNYDRAGIAEEAVCPECGSFPS
jgi:hypothetical protein